MAIEIERKFIVNSLDFLSGVYRKINITQGYFAQADHNSIRIRLADQSAFLTIKGEAKGISRSEFEYEIPFEDAKAMLEQFCGGRTIQKIRHLIKFDGATWEVDCFSGRLSGLIVAEIELENENQNISIPPWAGKEVTGDYHYSNHYLCCN